MKLLSVIAPVAILSFAVGCATTPGAPTQKAKTVEPAPAPVYVVADLQGARAGAVDALLGAPALTRREGAGEYRRYTLTTCALILILYPDETGAPAVAHMDAAATSSGGEKPDLEACLAAG